MFEIFVVFFAPSRQPLVYMLLLQVENQFAESWNWLEIAIFLNYGGKSWIGY